MFRMLRIFNRRLIFNWKPEEGEFLVIRNKLTKTEYYEKPCTPTMQRNGIDLMTALKPSQRDVPLEVVSRRKGRKDLDYNVDGITPYNVYYQISFQQNGTFVDVQLPSQINEEWEGVLPDDIIYFDLITPDEAKIPLYLPKLSPGNNRFWFINPGPNCRIDFSNPRLNEDGGENNSLSGVFKLINGYPPQIERRG